MKEFKYLSVCAMLITFAVIISYDFFNNLPGWTSVIYAFLVGPGIYTIADKYSK